MRECFEGIKFNKASIAMLATIDKIVAEYIAAGFRLTLRQLYYQLVSRDIIPNTERSYKNIGSLVARGRTAGLLDWSGIEDRARRPQKASQWDDIGELIDSCERSYRLPRMQGQDQIVELWVEKDALAGVLAPIAHEYHITLMVNRGYSSASAMKESAERIRWDCEAIGVRDATVLYLGDLDPSGEDMVRDVRDRLGMFANGGRLVNGRPLGGKYTVEDDEDAAIRKRPITIDVRKIALTPAQVMEYNPPPNPAKLTDPRAAAFVEEHGEHSWEVDALPPKVLRRIIEGALDGLIDQDAVAKIKRQEMLDIERLRKAIDGMEDA